MAKKLIRLTEQDLHRIVNESVNKVLNEIGNTNRGQYMLGRLAGRKYANNHNSDESGEVNKIGSYARKQKQYDSIYNPFTSGFSDGHERKDGQEKYNHYKKWDQWDDEALNADGWKSYLDK